MELVATRATSAPSSGLERAICVRACTCAQAWSQARASLSLPVRGLLRERRCWAEAPIKIARMTLTIKLDGNWISFQLANNTPPLSVTGSVIAPSARMVAGSTHNGQRQRAHPRQ